MKRSSFAPKAAFAMLSAMLLALPLALTAQDAAEQHRDAAPPSASATAAKPTDPLENLKFRNLGPAVGGGRITAVAGVPGQPNIYYAGAAAGGVFKTVDGGMSWKAIFEKQPVASIGAMALAPSNPNLIWVGTGEANMRNDVSTGKGVYFSPDAGTTWRLMGLADAGQISSVVIHPTNPDVVFIGALGHQWGPNKDRGVFRTTDGGKNWQKVLYVDENTGVADMAMDPTNPLVLYAAMWQVHRTPWMLDNGGPNSALYRSNDGGATWTKLTDGIPKGSLGRIGIAIARSNPAHVYALIEANKGRLFESRDYGDHWVQVSDNHAITARPFYFNHFHVAPDREDRLYFLSFDILQSDDGGKTAHVISRSVHPDNHDLWIDPTHPERMVEGNDGGVYTTADGGRTWRFLDNIPIEQFYMVADDGKQPYMLCGGLQDNNAWCGPSSSLLARGIGGVEWFTATGGDGEYAVPAGHDSGLIYVDSQNGSIQRLDTKTGLSQRIRPYIPGIGAMQPADLKYRFNWTTPIVVSPSNPNDVYTAGNVVFHSTDSGMHWTTISPDLTRNDKQKQKSSGGEIELDLSGAETFDTILSMAISPVDPNVIWVGTDDGLVQMTKDGGKTWSNVTVGIKGLPEWGRLQQIEASPFSADTCYLAFDFHEVENNHPYVFKTHDFGKSWTSINKGLPDDEPARVVREDPNHRGLLVAGNEVGVYYSANDGESWTRLKSNFPTAPVYDIKFIKQSHDLVVATHGRGLFVLDNVTPLEEMAQVGKADFKLFSVLPTVRWHTWNRRDSSPGEYVAPNPMSGAVIQYYLSKDLQASPEMKRLHQTPVKIVITDAAGQNVRTFYGVPKAGINRVSWDMSYQGPVPLDLKAAHDSNDDEADAGPRGGGGPAALPGSYKVSVTANGQTRTMPFELRSDPRVNVPAENFRAQLKAALEVRDEVSALNIALNRAEILHTQLVAVQRFLSSGDVEQGGVTNAAYVPVLEKARALDGKVRAFQQKIYNADIQAGSKDNLHYLERFYDRLQRLLGAVEGPYGEAPNEMVQEEMTEVRKELQTWLQQFNDLVKNDVSDFNKLAIDKGANTLFAGGAIELKPAKAKGVGQQ